MVLAFLSLKASMGVATSQQWTVMQTLTDACLTREVALGSRLPFDEIKGDSSPWPVYPSMDTSTVTVGRMPGGKAVTATLKRTRRPVLTNLADGGGIGDQTSNPASMEGWKIQSLLIYKVGQRDYVKSRTTLRVR